MKLKISLAALLLIGACSDSVDINQAARHLNGYYVQHPLERDWKVLGVEPDEKTGGLAVHIEVLAQGDIDKFKKLSRMDQFAAAKLACPKMNADLSTAIGADTRIWIYLRAKKKKITSTICPQ